MQSAESDSVKDMNNGDSRSKHRGIKIIAVLLIIAAAAYCGFRWFQQKEATRHAGRVLETMKDIIPDFGVDTGESSGQGKDPLPALVVDGKDIVGCIEIPSIDLIAPVTAADQDEEGFATIVSGSPVKGRLRIRGEKGNVFRQLAKAKPGDKVAFTDIDGVRYNYRVTTQYHLKDWDEGDNDLMLCYRSDEQTSFVLGCTSAE